MDLLCCDGRLLNVREDALRDRTFVDGAGREGIEDWT
jgi:hypothetical protein